MKILKVYVPWAMLIVSFFYFAALAFLSQNSWGGADNIVHYRIARYAFKYPELFLDLWGKPLFTLLSSPLAQLGYGYMKLFNVIVAIFTAFFTWRVTKLIQLDTGFVAIAAVLFAPVYFLLIPSAMTELLFGLIIILSIYLFFNERFLFSAIAISFLPFARNEGFILIPIFLLAYILKKKYYAIPFVATGFLIFSLAGWSHFDNFFWIFDNNPYKGASDIYGHGTLFHFVKRSPDMFGIPLLILFVVGIAIIKIKVFKDKFKLTNDFFLFLLVIASAAIYFAAHSYVWWKGLGGSLGLTRVIAGIIPLVAVTGVYALDKISGKVWVKHTIAMVAILLIVYIPIKKYDVPFGMDAAEKMVKETSEWMIENDLDQRFIFYYNPVFCHYLEIDPYDKEKSWEQIWDRESPASAVKPGALVIWDAHFGPNEGHMPKDKLLNDPAFRVIKHLIPDHPFKVLNGYDYEIYVFERIAISEEEM